MPLSTITIYTDGSCHTQHKIGGWAAILFVDTEKIILSETIADTTHQRMELTAFIKSIEYVQQHYPAAKTINLITDSQYMIDLPRRREKLFVKNFSTNNGKLVQNADLVKKFFNLLDLFKISFTKVKSHQKDGSDNYNSEADKLSRKMVRQAVDKLPAL